MKQKAPSAGDVIKAVATQQNETINYTTAWRSLKGSDSLQTYQQMASFQLIIPYLQSLSRDNPDSKIIWESHENTNRLKRIFVCPSFMNETIKLVLPVISVDGAHMDSKWKGTMITATALTSNRELYLIEFAFTEDNEDYQTWKWFMENLKIILTNLEMPYGDGTCPYNRFVFVSDRCKGLKKSLEETFPKNLSTNCAFHIKENVRTKYGAAAAKYVIVIAKEFSSREEDRLFEAVGVASQPAMRYLCTIPKDVWRSTQWRKEELPQRYGMVTSNASEATNSWLRDARTLTWAHALETIVDKMINRVSDSRQKYKGKADEEIVPFVKQLLTKRWRMVAGYVVKEVQEGGDVFKVNEMRGDDSDREDGNDEEPQSEEIPQGPAQVVSPVIKECSCGKWQEHQYPCRHALAWFRLWQERNFQWILDNEVADIWRFKTLKQLYQPNLFPVVMDSVRADGVTLPPNVRRPAGRPKRKRLRKRPQREGMIVLEGTEGNNGTEEKESDENVGESEQNSGNDDNRNNNPME